VVVNLPPDRSPGSSWRSLLRTLGTEYSVRARRGRARLFLQTFDIKPTDRVLDLGGSDGAHIAALGLTAHIFVADIDHDAVEAGAKKYGYTPVPLDASGHLPFPDGYFDVVFCSSVIEHVTVPQDEVYDVTSTGEFRSRARRSQQSFADEIRRVSKRFFVQTPYRYFPLESHTWLPGVVAVLPRPWQIEVIRRSARWWPKSSIPDFHLLNVGEFQGLFPDAHVVREKSAGITKSLIAIKQIH
jgi:cyclopropane fatty-acyl-phospholipid synthase-like methyltransferase